MSSTTCKADTVAAAAQPALSHQQPAPNFLVCPPLVSSRDVNIAAGASAVDAELPQPMLSSTERRQELPSQPQSEDNPPAEFSLEGSWGLIQKYQAMAKFQRENTEEWDRVVRADSQQGDAEIHRVREQYRKLLVTHITRQKKKQNTSAKLPSFFSLPVHIRTQIYSYLLTDPDSPSTVVNIKRQLQLPCYKLTRAPDPTPCYTLSPQPQSPFTTSILLANKAIYAEALPILYADKIFYPYDLEGLLIVFLDQLSPFARKCINSIRLLAEPPGTGPFKDRKARAFHWAITCAQVASLNGTLLKVEVCGLGFLSPKTPHQYITRPLCKIKPQKWLVRLEPTGFERDVTDDDHVRFAELLRESEEFLRSDAKKKREEKTRADAKEKAFRAADEKTRQQVLAARHARELMTNAGELQERNAATRKRLILREDELRNAQRLERLNLPDWIDFPKVCQAQIEQDLSKVKGLGQFQVELAALEEQDYEEYGYEFVRRPSDATGSDVDTIEDWDVVSVRSGKFPVKDRGQEIDDDWQDTASTIVADDNEDDESHDRTVIS
jgi:hypothetical protein